jgi:hypothetical protein
VSKATKREMATTKSVSIEWTTVNVGFGIVVEYCDPKCPSVVKCNINHVYINS